MINVFYCQKMFWRSQHCPQEFRISLSNTWLNFKLWFPRKVTQSKWVACRPKTSLAPHQAHWVEGCFRRWKFPGQRVAWNFQPSSENHFPSHKCFCLRQYAFAAFDTFLSSCLKAQFAFVVREFSDLNIQTVQTGQAYFQMNSSKTVKTLGCRPIWTTFPFNSTKPSPEKSPVHALCPRNALRRPPKADKFKLDSFTGWNGNWILSFLPRQQLQ